MNQHPPAYSVFSTTGAPFLPLAFRVATSFGLVVIHLALTPDLAQPIPGESLYLILLLLFLGQSLWEVARSVQQHGQLFAPPLRPWIRTNLILDILLVALLCAFQGVDQERFSTIYIFPVLASAFYLGIPEIIAVSVFSSVVHTTTVLTFASGLLPSFGHSRSVGPELLGTQAFTIAFATLQIFATALVVVLIRKHLENLRSNLRKSEAAVDELSALYQRVFHSMYSGLITLDLQGRITSANPAAEAILRHPLEFGTSVRELALLGAGRGVELPEDRRFEQAWVTPDGKQRLMGGSLVPIRDSEGIIRGNLLMFQDLTEIKALEERTRLSERMATVGELSASLAHELRNPMASIQGCIQLLRREPPSPQMMERLLAILDREGGRVNAIISDFLAFARPREPRSQALWLPEVMEDIKASWETDPRCAGLPLYTAPPPAIWIPGDPLTVHQVFTNLLSNARKAVRELEAPRLEIRFVETPDHVSIYVMDNGCGMTREQVASLYLPFTSGFQEGTGLGMSLVYRFLQQMGWGIQVESEVNRGTRIQLDVPRIPPPDRLDVPSCPVLP